MESAEADQSVLVTQTARAKALVTVMMMVKSIEVKVLVIDY